MSDDDGNGASGVFLTVPARDPPTVPSPDPGLQGALLVLDLTRDPWPVAACTNQLEQVTGFGREELLGRPWPSLWDTDADPVAVEILSAAIEAGAPSRVDIRILRRGEPPVDATVTVAHGGSVDGPIAFLAVQAPGVVESSGAYQDPLTGLPNRALLERDLDVAILRAIRTQHSIAILFCDLNRFKPVNDELGHAAGDAVLREVARRLRGSVRAHDLVSCYGGDEFVIVLTDLDGDAEARARAVARSVRASVGRPIDVDGAIRTIGVSVGVSVFPRDAEDAGGLLATADRAMYRAKNANRPRRPRDAGPAREALLERARAAQLQAGDLRATAEATIQDIRTTLNAREARRPSGGTAPDRGEQRP